MKLEAKALANTLATIAGVCYLGRAVLIVLFPDLMLRLARALTFGLNLQDLYATPSMRAALIGLATAVILGWLAGWVIAKLYNKYAKVG